jgi:hypothetical protein
MSDHTLGRREVLLGAGVAAGGVVATGVGLAAPASARDGRDDDERDDLDGSWLVTRQDDGDETQVRAVFSFAGGDVLVEHDILPAGPPFTGTWESHDHKRFRATIWSGFPGEQGPGSPGVAVRVRLEGKVRKGTLSGTYSVTVFDPTGAEIPEEAATGTFFDGEPIEA